MKLSPAVCLILFTTVLLTGCATSTPRGSAKLAALRPEAEGIRWPEEYRPEKAAFFVHNEITVQAPPDVVWDILVQAEAWPGWYEGAENVSIKPPARARLEPEAVFTWKTMGLNLESRVAEFERPTRLAWESRKRVIRGYHAWLILPTETGCRVITDESFHGFLAYMQGTFIPNKLHRLHDVFLVELKKKAEAKAAAK